MPVVREETFGVNSDEDVVRVRQVTRQWAIDLAFSLVDQTKIVTAASELARNTLIHGGGGTTHVEVLHENGRRGLRLTFVDKGPGIADLEQALRDGFTTGSGLGLGLGGARRLASEFDIVSRPGQGTQVRLIAPRGDTPSTATAADEMRPAAPGSASIRDGKRAQQDPLRILIQCRERLAPGGAIIASLPNSGHWYFRASILAGKFPQDDKGLFDRTHLRFYMWDGWVDLFERAGLRLARTIPTAHPAMTVVEAVAAGSPRA